MHDVLDWASTPLSAWLLISVVRGIRAERLAERSEHRICPYCLYDLRSHERSGKCPECGMPYDIDQVVSFWTRGRVTPGETKPEGVSKAS